MNGRRKFHLTGEQLDIRNAQLHIACNLLTEKQIRQGTLTREQADQDEEEWRRNYQQAPDPAVGEVLTWDGTDYVIEEILPDGGVILTRLTQSPSRPGYEPRMR